MPQPVALAPASSIQGRAVRLFAPLNRLWARIWFQERNTIPLEIIRIGLGAAMLLHYAFATPHVLTFWGDDGWMPRTAVSHGIHSSFNRCSRQIDVAGPRNLRCRCGLKRSNPPVPAAQQTLKTT